MTAPDESRAARWAPIWTFACRKAREANKMRALLAERNHQLAVVCAQLAETKAQLAGTEALLVCKTDQAERAMVIATASEWSAADVSWCAEHGLDVER